jgi:uncharacterized protein YjeT (DUF2065 family)
MLVFEGIMPFLNPDRFRKTVLMVSNLDDRTLRLIGAASMAAGVIVLSLSR